VKGLHGGEGVEWGVGLRWRRRWDWTGAADANGGGSAAAVPCVTVSCIRAHRSHAPRPKAHLCPARMAPWTGYRASSWPLSAVTSCRSKSLRNASLNSVLKSMLAAAIV